MPTDFASCCATNTKPAWCLEASLKCHSISGLRSVLKRRRCAAGWSVWRQRSMNARLVRPRLLLFPQARAFDRDGVGEMQAKMLLQEFVHRNPLAIDLNPLRPVADLDQSMP